MSVERCGTWGSLFDFLAPVVCALLALELAASSM